MTEDQIKFKLKIAEILEQQQKYIDSLAEFEAYALPIVEELSGLDLSFSKCGIYLDIDNTTHEQTVEIIKRLGGNWHKDYNDSSITYTKKEPDEAKYSVRIYGSAPPPNCRVVERKRTVPEHEETYYEIKCDHVVGEETINLFGRLEH